jgi:hypothetical protein
MERSQLRTLFLDTLIISMMAFGAQYSRDYIVSRFPEAPAGFVDALIPIGSILLAIVLIVIVHAQLMALKVARRFLDPIGSFEGVWVEETSLTDRPFSIAFIEYNRDQRVFEHYGFGYGAKELQGCLDNSGRAASGWRAEQLLLDAKRKALFFYSQDANVHDQGGRQRLRNVGELYYRRRGAKTLTGQVYDLADDKATEPFLITRMSKVSGWQMRKALKGREAADHRDYALLILYMLRKDSRLQELAARQGFR